MYRMTKKAEAQRSKLAAMRRSREAARANDPTPEYPAILAELRRRIVIEAFDFDHQVHVLELHRTSRVDCYRVVADGVEWKRRVGWSKILAGLRKSLPRVMSERRI